MERGIFVRRKHKMSKEVIFPFVRIIAVLRTIENDKYYEEVEELCEISCTSSGQRFQGFVREAITVFGTEYLRSTGQPYLTRLIATNSRHGFPGFIGNWYCQHRKWKKYAVLWAGQFKGKRKIEHNA